MLAVNVAGTSITASYNAATETLMLSGSDTLAHYQQVLDSVTFSSGSNPTNSGANPTRTLTWTLNDGAGSNNLSTAHHHHLDLAGGEERLQRRPGDRSPVPGWRPQRPQPRRRSARRHAADLADEQHQRGVADHAAQSGRELDVAGTGDFNNDNDADILFRDTVDRHASCGR